MRYFLAALLALLFVAWLTGCATTQDWVQRHPRASAVIAATLVTSIALSTRGHRHDERMPEMSVPLVDCTNPASCQ